MNEQMKTIVKMAIQTVVTIIGVILGIQIM